MLKTATVMILLNWISVNTDYDTKNFNTKILEVSKKEIQRIACRWNCPVVAFYKKNEFIYITKMDFDENFCNQSILIHEMIHVLQNDKEMENAFREQEAYLIQEKFLMQRSIENNFLKNLNIRVCRKQQNF